jgi:hypothetical protein
MAESSRLMQRNEVVSFPFIKLREKDGRVCEEAVKVFEEFTYKRIDKALFDNADDTVRNAILYGGGSPREYLRVLQFANMYADENKGVMDNAALEKGVSKLAAKTSQYITEEDLKQLKTLKDANVTQRPIPYGPEWQDLLEKLIVLEYNDGTYKRVNPVVEVSALYKEYVG